MLARALRAGVTSARLLSGAQLNVRAEAGAAARCGLSTTASSAVAAPGAGSTSSGGGLPQLLVLGGNGFVGSAVCREAVARGLSVASLNRTGPPTWAGREGAAWVQAVRWTRGDAADAAVLQAALAQGPHGAIPAVVSCIGAFGSNEFMERINGDVNAQAARVAREAGARRFVFVSAADFKLPDAVLRGYFVGKRKAEAAALEAFGDNAVLLRPGMIHGTRHLPNGLALPLGLVGAPLESLFSTAPIKALSRNLPGIGPFLIPPLSVETIARAAVEGGMQEDIKGGVWDVERLAHFASS